MYYVRDFLTEEIDRIHLLNDEESGNEGSSVREREGRPLTELIEKLVTTSKPPELKTLEFDGNPKFWCLRMNGHERRSEKEREWLNCKQCDMQSDLRMHDCEHVDHAETNEKRRQRQTRLGAQKSRDYNRVVFRHNSADDHILRPYVLICTMNEACLYCKALKFEGKTEEK
ncbi:unnamed protein product, partial [Onchocerca ochengi]|uniref:Nanos-type domain-containing protein n=1 Tax=Onchocerca ochengi TaxID=42157 RepID=A0A182EIK7_ONCOC